MLNITSLRISFSAQGILRLASRSSPLPVRNQVWWFRDFFVGYTFAVQLRAAKKFSASSGIEGKPARCCCKGSFPQHTNAHFAVKLLLSTPSGFEATLRLIASFVIRPLGYAEMRDVAKSAGCYGHYPSQTGAAYLPGRVWRCLVARRSGQRCVGGGTPLGGDVYDLLSDPAFVRSGT